MVIIQSMQSPLFDYENHFMCTISVQLSDNLSEQLEALAKATGHTESFLVYQAIEVFVSHGAWQIMETEQALQEAGDGDFASNEEIEVLFQRLGIKPLRN